MQKTLIEIYRLGLGIFDLTREQAEKIVKELSNGNNIKQGRKMVDNLLTDAEKARKRLDRKIDRKLKNMINKYGLATKKDLLRLERRIKKLEKNK